MSDYHDITAKDMEAFPALGRVLDRAVEHDFQKRSRTEVKRILAGDYISLEKSARAAASVNAGMDLPHDNIPRTKEELRQRAQKKYQNIANDKRPSHIVAIRNSGLLSEDQFLQVFSQPALIQAMVDAYVDEYLKKGQKLIENPEVKKFILFEMQYQPWAHLSREEKVIQAEASISTLKNLLGIE